MNHAALYELLDNAPVAIKIRNARTGLFFLSLARTNIRRIAHLYDPCCREHASGVEEWH